MGIPSTPAPHPGVTSAFPVLLRAWRQKRRLSQLDLALSSGVSQRHVSFLESGRARPSREMILQLSETLEVPLRDRNDWLTAAGFAPLFHARSLDDPQMAQVLHAVRRMLDNHAPYPAAAIDRAWNLRLANQPFHQMTALLGGDLWTRVGGPERNLLRLFFHPQGIRPYVANWNVAGPLLWQRARREAEALGGDLLRRLLAELGPAQDPGLLRPVEVAPLMPVLTLEIEKDDVRLALFTVISTFGTPQDITADELRIESLFPADEATEQLFRGLSGMG